MPQLVIINSHLQAFYIISLDFTCVNHLIYTIKNKPSTCFDVVCVWQSEACVIQNSQIRRSKLRFYIYWSLHMSMSPRASKESDSAMLCIKLNKPFATPLFVLSECRKISSTTLVAFDSWRAFDLYAPNRM